VLLPRSRRTRCLEDGAVGPDWRTDDQGEGEGVAWSGVNFDGAVGAVDHDDRVVGALAEAVDANLAHAAAEGLNQVSAQVGAERPGKLRVVAEEAKGQFKGVLVSDPDWQASAAGGLSEQDDVVVLAGVGDAADVADWHVEEVAVGGGWHGVVLLRAPA
jgi:hypothetical protein